MKILFHCYEFPPQAGGVGGYLLQMATALQRTGHEAVVVTSRSPGLPEEARTECGLVYRLYDRAEVRTDVVRDRVLAIAREQRVDVLEGADHHGEMASILRQKSRPPVVLKIHGSNPVRILQRSQRLRRWQWVTINVAAWRNRAQTEAEAYSIEHADMALVPSHRMLQELRAQGLRLPATVAVVPNPMTSPSAPVPRAEAVMPTILLVGRIDIGKGIQYLRMLLERISARLPDAVLEIAGDDSYARGLGSMRAWLRAHLGGQAPRVRFLGKLGRPELDAAYARAWVLIVPSRWDNFPTVLLEGGARGVPVVASPHGGMPEMLDGTLCATHDPGTREFADAVTRLLVDQDLRWRAGRSLQEKVARCYAPDVIVAQYVAQLASWGVGAAPRATGPGA